MKKVFFSILFIQFFCQAAISQSSQGTYVGNYDGNRTVAFVKDAGIFYIISFYESQTTKYNLLITITDEKFSGQITHPILGLGLCEGNFKKDSLITKLIFSNGVDTRSLTINLKKLTKIIDIDKYLSKVFGEEKKIIDQNLVGNWKFLYKESLETNAHEKGDHEFMGLLKSGEVLIRGGDYEQALKTFKFEWYTKTKFLYIQASRKNFSKDLPELEYDLKTDTLVTKGTRYNYIYLKEK